MVLKCIFTFDMLIPTNQNYICCELSQSLTENLASRNDEKSPLLASVTSPSLKAVSTGSVLVLLDT